MAIRTRLAVPLILGFFVWTSSTLADELMVGVAVTDITPPVPYRMCGYFSERLSTGIKDPLSAKAVVLQQGDELAALVFCDIIGLPLDVSARVREQASRETGIPAEHIAVAATHSHTGPLYFGALRKHFHDRAVEQHGSDPHEKTDYPGLLAQKLVQLIKKAKADAVPVTLKAGNGREDRLSFHRRFLMKDGSVRFNPGQLNPDIVRPVGVIDPEVGIVMMTAVGSGKPLGSLVAFALHLDTVGGTEYSADYPGHMQNRLREKYGPEFVSLFGIGTCGDINHFDVTIRGRRSAQEIGTMLADTVVQSVPKLDPVAEPLLAVRRATVNAPLQQYSPQDIAAACKKMDSVADGRVPFLERVEAYKITALQLRQGPTLPMEVQVFRLSDDVAIVTLPGEVLVDLGLAIKQASPFKTTLVIELTNDTPGYIPTKKAFAEGHYEPTNSRIQPGGGEMMVETAVRLLKDLKRRPEGT